MRGLIGQSAFILAVLYCCGLLLRFPEERLTADLRSSDLVHGIKAPESWTNRLSSRARGAAGAAGQLPELASLLRLHRARLGRGAAAL